MRNSKQVNAVSNVHIFGRRIVALTALLSVLLIAALVWAQVQDSHNLVGVGREVASHTSGSYGMILKWDPITGRWSAQLDSLSATAVDSLAIRLLKAAVDTIYITGADSRTAVLTIVNGKANFSVDPTVGWAAAWIDSANIANSGIAIGDINNSAIGFVEKLALKDSLQAAYKILVDSLIVDAIGIDPTGAVYGSVIKYNHNTGYFTSQDDSTVAFADSLRRMGITAAAPDSTGRISLGTPWDLTDGQYSGKTVQGKAAVNLVFGEVCYMTASGTYHRADADSTNTMICRVMALESISANNYGLFLVEGYICEADWTTVQTAGADVYVTTSPGVPGTTQPSGSGDQSQKLGYCIGTDIMFFRPDWTMVEVP